MADDSGTWQVVKKRARATRVVGLMSEAAAERLEREQKVFGLARALRSPEARALLAKGYVFERVLRGSESVEEEDGQAILPIADNHWNDVLLFRQQ